jgi:hypothetical protein
LNGYEDFPLEAESNSVIPSPYPIPAGQASRQGFGPTHLGPGLQPVQNLLHARFDSSRQPDVLVKSPGSNFNANHEISMARS